MVEELRAWIAEETMAQVFRSLLALEVLSLKVDAPAELLETIRKPLGELYEFSREPDDETEGSDV